jgi:hypothetical protein
MKPLLRVVAAALAACAPLSAIAVTHKTVYNYKVKPAKHAHLKADKHTEPRGKQNKSSVKEHVKFDQAARKHSKEQDFGVHKEN